MGASGPHACSLALFHDDGCVCSCGAPLDEWATAPGSGPASFDVAHEMLAQLIGLPDGVEIVAAKGLVDGAVRLFVTGTGHDSREHLSPMVTRTPAGLVWEWARVDSTPEAPE